MARPALAAEERGAGAEGGDARRETRPTSWVHAASAVVRALAVSKPESPAVEGAAHVNPGMASGRSASGARRSSATSSAAAPAPRSVRVSGKRSGGSAVRPQRRMAKTAAAAASTARPAGGLSAKVAPVSAPEPECHRPRRSRPARLDAAKRERERREGQPHREHRPAAHGALALPGRRERGGERGDRRQHAGQARRNRPPCPRAPPAHRSPRGAAERQSS